MKIQLIQGQFEKGDAIEILTQMIHVKIQYHERKINLSGTEEDIKMREKRIKELQKDLYEIRNYVNEKKSSVNLQMVLEM